MNHENTEKYAVAGLHRNGCGPDGLHQLRRRRPQVRQRGLPRRGGDFRGAGGNNQEYARCLRSHLCGDAGLSVGSGRDADGDGRSVAGRAIQCPLRHRMADARREVLHPFGRNRDHRCREDDLRDADAPFAAPAGRGRGAGRSSAARRNLPCAGDDRAVVGPDAGDLLDGLLRGETFVEHHRRGAARRGQLD